EPMRCSFFLSCIYGLLSFSSAFAASTNHHPFVIRGPYVQLATPNSIYVVWRTETNLAPSVHYGTTPVNLDRQVAGKDIIIRYGTTNRILPDPKLLRLHSAPQGTWQYEARITGLRPDTRYFYALYDGEKRLTDPDPAFNFRTNPVKGARKPMRFWVVGDSGTGRETQGTVHSAMVDLTIRELD